MRFAEQNIRFLCAHHLANPVNGSFHIRMTVFQCGNAKALNIFRQFVLQNTQCLWRAARHQYTLSLRQKMPHQICDRMRFPCSRRPLYDNGRFFFNQSRNGNLLFVGGFRQIKILCVSINIICGIFYIIIYRLIFIRSPFTFLDNLLQSRSSLRTVFYFLNDTIEKLYHTTLRSTSKDANIFLKTVFCKLWRFLLFVAWMYNLSATQFNKEKDS